LRFNGGKVSLRFVVVVVLSFALLSFGLSFIFANKGSYGTETDGVPDKIEAIPVPLGAYNVIYTRPDSNSDRGLSFDVRLPVDQVVDYYKRVVQSQGWAQFQENRNIPNEISLYNVWNDKQDRMPYSLDLLVRVVRGKVSGDLWYFFEDGSFSTDPAGPLSTLAAAEYPGRCGGGAIFDGVCDLADEDPAFIIASGRIPIVGETCFLGPIGPSSLEPESGVIPESGLLEQDSGSISGRG